jgi:hypothetical protein
MRILAALLVLLAALPLHAQTGSVHGRALSADGAPVPLSVVRLLPGKRTTLTDAQGVFRFDTVAAGTYRLQMERIGHTAAPSAEFAVAPGAATEQTLRAALRPVVLEAVSNGPPACYTRDRLGEVPAIQALWNEAKKGVEHRRAFAAQYAYTYNQRTRARVHLRMVRDRNIASDTAIIAHPDSAAARRARSVAKGDTVQTRNSLMIQLPDELRLLRDDFLVGHCLEANPQRDPSGVYVLRFRPVRAPRDSVTLAGALRIDERTYAVREVEFRYQEGRREWAAGTITYGEVQTPAGMVRLPRSGTVRADPSGPIGMVVSAARGTVEFHSHRDFRRVR